MHCRVRFWECEAKATLWFWQRTFGVGMNDMERYSSICLENMPYIERYLFILMSRKRALPEPERYLLSLSLSRTALRKRDGGVMKSKAVRGPGAVLKRHETCRDLKAVRGRGDVLKRHETCRNPKYTKAAMNCRNPKYSKAARDSPHSEIYQSGNELPHSERCEDALHSEICCVIICIGI